MPCIILAGLIVLVLLMARAIRNAPEGREDNTGFHFATPAEEAAEERARRHRIILIALVAFAAGINAAIWPVALFT
jgi:hypothetical protein